MLNLSHDVEVPALHVVGLVLETLERNLDLDLVAVIGDATL